MLIPTGVIIVTEMVDIFKSLAEESRLRILALLIQEEMCVCEIKECLNMKQSNVSRHLTALKNSGILDSHKEAQWSYFRISDKFKEDNSQLWLYIKQNLINLPSYKIDNEKCNNCKQQNLCNCDKSSEE